MIIKRMHEQIAQACDRVARLNGGIQLGHDRCGDDSYRLPAWAVRDHAQRWHGWIESRLRAPGVSLPSIESSCSHWATAATCAASSPRGRSPTVFNICARPEKSSPVPGMFSPNSKGSKTRTRCPRSTSLPPRPTWTLALSRRSGESCLRSRGLTADSRSTPGADSPLLNSNRYPRLSRPLSCVSLTGHAWVTVTGANRTTSRSCCRCFSTQEASACAGGS